MDRQHAFNRFRFNEHTVFNEHIESQRFFANKAFVNNGTTFRLVVEIRLSSSSRMRHHSLDWLNESGTFVPVYFDSRFDNALCHVRGTKI